MVSAEDSVVQVYKAEGRVVTLATYERTATREYTGGDEFLVGIGNVGTEVSGCALSLHWCVNSPKCGHLAEIVARVGGAAHDVLKDEDVYVGLGLCGLGRSARPLSVCFMLILTFFLVRRLPSSSAGISGLP